jgi:hypothetical protein
VIEVRGMSSFFEEGRIVSVRLNGLSQDTLNGLAKWTSCITRDENRLKLTLNTAGSAPQVLKFLVEQGTEVFEFTPQKVSLEDRFLEIVGGDEGL